MTPRDPFAPGEIDDETRVFNEALEARLAGAPPVVGVDPAVTRAARERGEGPFPAPQPLAAAEWRDFRGPNGRQRVRLLVPDRVRGVYLHVHGGGWTFGAPEHSDRRNLELARRCSVAVASVAYRLAPEHPWPAPADDCEAAAAWLIANARRELGTEVLAIGGQSAGAHLAAVTLLRLRDRHGYRDWRAANFVSGVFDLSLTPSARRWGSRDLLVSTPLLEWWVENLVPQRERRAAPEVSPMYADLSFLPPALFTVGTMDPLLDDSLFMHARWRAAGNPAELAVWPGGVHCFNLFQIGLARRADARIASFLREAMRGAPARDVDPGDRG